jgi:integrase
MEKADRAEGYKLAALRDRGKDLTKEWYIEFYVYSEEENDLVRKRVKIPTKYSSEESRRKFAAKKIDQINDLLRKDYIIKKPDANPTAAAPATSTENLLLVQSLTCILSSSAYLRDRSTETYQTAVNKAREVFGEEFRFCDLTPGHVLQFRDADLRKGNAASTANNSVHNFGRLYNEVRKRYNLIVDPFKELENLPETQVSTANIAFTNEDRQKLEEYLRENDPELFAFTRFMYYAFIRPGELRKLTVRYINVRDWLITIPGEKAKNRKTRVNHVINPLKAYITFSEKHWNNFIFGEDLMCCPTQAGRNLAYNRNLAALEACGLSGKNYTLYSWRHAGVVNAYLSGVGIKALQDMLGHYSLEETAVYLKTLGLRIDQQIETYNW